MAILTISREFGSGGREVGHMTAKRLGYAYVDRVSLLAALRASDPRWERFGDEYDEHTPTVWERFDWSFRGYAALLQRCLLEAAAGGRVVIVGRGAALLLTGVPTALHVRVVAPLAARIERIMRREHADHDSVRRMVERIDRERAGFIRAVYHRPWDDPALYDATYDTSLLDPPAIIQDILSRLAAREQAAAEEARRIIDGRLAAARVRATLCTDPELQLPTLEVLEAGGEILVRGVLHRPDERRRIEEVAGALAGGLPLRFDLRYR
ncbi:MAG TPA: cytidylate kinase-like family protein [Candidatus Methanoperedens sp.]|nr:cytidylate kinase-like family protein [Candidatus Methanoperedens sp.]